MPIAATGFFKQPMVMKIMLANSVAFQTVVAAMDADAALAKIKIHDAQERDTDDEDDEAAVGLPRIIIETTGEMSRELSGTSLAFSMNMDLQVHFEFWIPSEAEAANREDERNWFMNQIAAIWKDIEDQVNARQQVGGQNVLAIRRYHRLNGPDRLTTEEMPLLDESTPAHNLPAWFISFQVEMNG